ncbi:MAG: hypothetical protein ACYC7E_16060 [Armatimonadota bacterium]
MRAIRAKCLDCCCGQRVEVRNCALPTCALWPHRLGPRAALAEPGVSKSLLRRGQSAKLPLG